MEFSLTSLQKHIPPLFRNLFFLTTVFFIAWMLFLDENNVFSQYGLYKQWKKVEEEKDFYKQEMETALEKYYAITDDQRFVEDYAREKYLMKKDNEDLFVVVPKK